MTIHLSLRARPATPATCHCGLDPQHHPPVIAGSTRNTGHRPPATGHHPSATVQGIALDYDGIDGETIDDIKAAFIKELETCRGRDIKNGYTGTGPHKDDFRLKAGGMDITAYGSQGQQRTAALSLKLAELEIFAAATDEYPILLLDDVMSELDLSRQSRLLKKAETRGVQTLLTCTHLEVKPVAYTGFRVEKGFVYNRHFP